MIKTDKLLETLGKILSAKHNCQITVKGCDKNENKRSVETNRRL